MDTLFKRIYLNGDPERLPKEDGLYICMIRGVNQPTLFQYDIKPDGELDYSKQWLKLVDYYLVPFSCEEIMEVLNSHSQNLTQQVRVEGISPKDFEQIVNEIMGG